MSDHEHIVSLSISNVKRLTAVKIDIKPDGDRIVIITGENGAGKSSVLDSIEMALSGRDSVPERPIRNGKETARVVIETETLVVTRTFTASNPAGYLKFENKEGFKASTPQKLLDDMIEKIGFDPLAFANMSPDEQASKLLKIFPTKIDLKANASFVKGAFEERTEVNREVKRLNALCSSQVFPDELPTEEVSISGLSKRSADLRSELNAVNEKTTRYQAKVAEVGRISDRIAELNRQIEGLQAQYETASLAAKEIAEEEVRKPADIQAELGTLDKQIQNAEQTNGMIRARAQQVSLKAALAAQDAKSKKLTAQLEKLQTERAAALQEAKFPVEGLSIDESGNVVLNNVPFAQASMAQKLIVGMSIAAASSNKLRVCLIKDASLLDTKSMKLVADIAKEKDLQVWMERVEDSSPCAVLIEDGSNIGAKDAPEIEDAKKETAEAPAGDFSLGGGPAPKKTRKKKADEENTNPFKA